MLVADWVNVNFGSYFCFKETIPFDTSKVKHLPQSPNTLFVKVEGSISSQWGELDHCRRHWWSKRLCSDIEWPHRFITKRDKRCTGSSIESPYCVTFQSPGQSVSSSTFLNTSTHTHLLLSFERARRGGAYGADEEIMGTVDTWVLGVVHIAYNLPDIRN